MVAIPQRVAVVRGPGGLPGIDAHLGAWLAFEAAGIRPTWLSGCSAGAVIGALEAGGMYAWQARELIEGLTTADVVRKRWGWKARLFWLESFCDPAPIAALLDNLLLPDFASLVTPFTVAATRMDETPREVAITTGDLRQAVLASMSIAGIWPYVQLDDGAFYSDGGTTERYPLPERLDDWDAVFVLDPVSSSSFEDRDRNIISRLLWNLEQLARLEASHLLEQYAERPNLHWLTLDVGSGSCLEFDHTLIAATFERIANQLELRGFGPTAHPQRKDLPPCRA